MSLVQHSSGSDQWFTPADIIQRAYHVLGAIDLDPASSAAANAVVGAQTYYTKEMDGLQCDWFGSIWCNPPGGKVNGKSLPLLFWEKLMKTRESMFFDHAIVMCFSIEQLQTTQGRDYPSMLGFPLCIPKKRVSFVQGDGKSSGSPAHANAIVYVPGRRNYVKAFADAFKDMGEIVNYEELKKAARAVEVPLTEQEKTFNRYDFAYGNLLCSTNHKPVRLAFKLMMTGDGLTDEQFRVWAKNKEWR